MRRHDAAQRVLDALREHGPMTANEIMHDTRLRHSQFRGGIAYIDSKLQAENGEPRIYDPHRGVYALPTSMAEFQPGLDWRIKTVMTMLMRIEQLITAAQIRFADDPQAQASLGRASGNIRGARHAIEDIQDAVG